jgi:hypothetical protein
MSTDTYRWLALAGRRRLKESGYSGDKNKGKPAQIPARPAAPNTYRGLGNGTARSDRQGRHSFRALRDMRMRARSRSPVSRQFLLALPVGPWPYLSEHQISHFLELKLHFRYKNSSLRAQPWWARSGGWAYGPASLFAKKHINSLHLWGAGPLIRDDSVIM